MCHVTGIFISLLLAFAVATSDGRWSKWTDWTKCSRSCGAGISFQTRRCVNSTGGLTTGCVGSRRQNRLCNIQDCPADDEDFRSTQCAAYNEKPYNGKYFQWVPVKRNSFPCELTCMPKGERFFVKFSDKVVDGTPCHDGSHDVCVDGKCHQVGCDLILNSTARYDKCRECNGRNSKCKLVKGKFELKDLEADYIEMFHIPARTTTITIKEEGDPSNYIALKNYRGDYILNGDWTINNPGTYKLNGHYAFYKRSRKEHSVTIDGPIDAPLTVETLALKAPVSFSYEYYIPNELGNGIPKTTYRWVVKNYGECSASCAGGKRKRNIACVASNDNRPVSDFLCNDDERPADSEECNVQPCPAHWFVGEWSSCSTSCGVGEKVRRVHCVRETKDGEIAMLSNSFCEGTPPAKNEKCSVRKVCPEWKTQDWSECSKSCGPGFRIRKVRCVGIVNYDSNILVETRCDLTIKPVLREACNLGSCNLTWVTGTWSQCSAHCGTGMKNRQVTCQNSKGRVFPDGYCDKVFKPRSVEDCLVPGPCKPMWYTTHWSKCSRNCGYGIQIRMIYCAEKVGSNLVILKKSTCKNDEEPLKMRKCHQLKPCISQYFANPWKPCSASCGTGLRFRKVRCYADTRIDYSEETCKSLKKPAAVELCNHHPCSGSSSTDSNKIKELATKDPSHVTTRRFEDTTIEKKTNKLRTTEAKKTEKLTQRPTTVAITSEVATDGPVTQRITTLPATTVEKRIITQIRTKEPEPTRVPIPAVIVKYHGPESIDEGSTVDYYCNAIGEPSPKITWTFQGKPIEQLGDRFLLLNGNIHLVIANVMKDDNGKLKCSASNIFGSDSKILDVKVSYEPSVIVTPTVADLKEGNSFFMTCDISGYPAPTITWRKNGRRLFGDSNRVRVTDTMVRFKSLLPADSGTYECHAENSVGSDKKSMSLNVQPDRTASACVDDPERANCIIIKQLNFCRHPFYAAACCKTCSGK